MRKHFKIKLYTFRGKFAPNLSEPPTMENAAIKMFKNTISLDSVGVISAKPLCDFFGLDWTNQQRMIKNDPILSQLMSKKPSTGIDGKTYQMIHFTKKGFI